MNTTAADILARFSDVAPIEVAYTYAEATSSIQKVKILRAFMADYYPDMECGLSVLVEAVRTINLRRMTIDGQAFDFTVVL